MSDQVLKKSLLKAKRKLVEKNREEDPYLVFVASDTLRERFGLPVDVSTIASDTDNEFDDIEFPPLRKQLLKIQEVLVSNLQTVLGGALPGREPSEIRVLAETPQYYILHDKLQVIEDSLKKECGVSYTTKSAHSIAAGQILDRIRIDKPDEDGPLWVINKPPTFWAGQWAAVQMLNHLIQCGVSSTEAIDYWIVSQLNVPVSDWAHVRGTTAQSIQNRITSTRQQINNTTVPNNRSRHNYLTPIYKSTDIDGKEHITVDNGLLHPRRDIADSSTIGTMASGYKGAGSKQLAIAILADLRIRQKAFLSLVDPSNEGGTFPLLVDLSDEDLIGLATKLHGNISDIAKSDGKGGWELSGKQVLDWIGENHQ